MSTSQTFTLTRNGKPVDPPSRQPKTLSLVDALADSDIFLVKKGKLLTSTTPVNSVRTPLNNSFIGTLFAAYSYHYKLVLRPDDVWLAIVITFADYIDNHAEEMRKCFVTHEGKNQLVLHISTAEATVENWSGVIKQFSVLVNENTIGSVRDWVEPRFTTTTENDSLIGRVALMGALKNYFSYACSIECGIPEVTLMGTLQDWKDLRSKIDRLADFGVEAKQEALIQWRDILVPIVDEFIASYEGKVNNDFWQSCANSSGGGSGPSYVSGWVLAFSPFLKGQWRLKDVNTIKTTGKYGKVETTDFKTSSTVEVPVKINDNGNEYDICFYAGGIVSTYDANTNTMRPSFDFAMFKMPDGTIKDKIDWMDTSVKRIDTQVTSMDIEIKSQRDFFANPLDQNNKPIPKSDFDKYYYSEGMFFLKPRSLEERAQTVTIPDHVHPLILSVYETDHKCDICDGAVGRQRFSSVKNSPCRLIRDSAYRCGSGCDYDCCFGCYDKNTQTSTI